MSNHKIITTLKKYQKTPRQSQSRREYFRLFEKKMLYRTTKTENAQTTKGMVNRVLRKLSTKIS